MTTEYTGRGDPARTLELLWGTQEAPRRGPRPKLTVERIARTAIELADVEGIGQLSMRRVAELLGVGQASLYTYVPGKNELLDVMLDAVLAELPACDEPDAGWRDRLARIARRDWAFYLRHPWMLEIAGHRPPMGPNTFAAYGSALDAVTGTGLPLVERIHVIDMIDGYVRGMAREKIDAAKAEERTGVSDDEWWSAQAPQWARHFDADRYPILADPSLSQAIFGDHDAKFTFGLERLLDGLETYLARR